MKLEDLLKIKLEQDLLSELSSKYNLETISKDKYLSLCKKKINKKIKNIRFLETKNKCKYSSENRCCARIWDNHYGTRCKYKRFLNTEYCKHHDKMIKRSGKLLFNRYDGDRPIFNEKGNRIPWFNGTNMEILDAVIQKQHNSLVLLINKERQIAPKI